MKRNSCIVLISLLIILAFPACTSEKNEQNDWRWKLIPKTSPDDFTYLSVSPISGHVAGAHILSNFLYLGQDAKSLEKIFLPETDGVEPLEVASGLDKFCFADEIWVITSNRQVLSYNPNTHSWTSYPEWSNLDKSVYCYAARDNRLILSSANKLGLFDGQWTTITKPFEYAVVSQDAAGTLWLLIDQGLYRLDGNSLSFVRSLDVPFAIDMFVSSTGEVWMSGDEVYLWRPAEASGSVDLVLGPGDHGSVHVKGIYEDSAGKIWIVTLFEVWVYAGEKLEQVNLPEHSRWAVVLPVFPYSTITRHDHVTWIDASAFDYQKDRLYAATNDGIYYLDVLDPSVQGGK